MHLFGLKVLLYSPSSYSLFPAHQIQDLPVHDIVLLPDQVEILNLPEREVINARVTPPLALLHHGTCVHRDQWHHLRADTNQRNHDATGKHKPKLLVPMFCKLCFIRKMMMGRGSIFEPDILPTTAAGIDSGRQDNFCATFKFRPKFVWICLNMYFSYPCLAFQRISDRQRKDLLKIQILTLTISI